MEIKMVDLLGQYRGIKDEVDKAIQSVITDSAFIKGKYVNSFSESLASYLNVKHVIPCGNGTDAIQLALMALDYEKGSEVITTPFTFVATAEVIALLGLKPVFVDIDPKTFNIDPESIKQAITSKTKCIIPVHLFGQSCDMQEILTVAQEHNLHVIEDNAQAIGAWYNLDGRKTNTGTMSDIGTLSFFPSKNLGCYGDGGAVMTNDDTLAAKIEKYSNHGSSKKYIYESVGINSRLDGIQAAILSVKLKYLDQYISSRQSAAARYDNLLANIPGLTLPYRAESRNHVFHQYTLTLESGRDELHQYLKTKGIPTGIYYPMPLHVQKPYIDGSSGEQLYLEISEKLAKQVISLPMHTELTEEMQTAIATSVKEHMALLA